jgi:flagellar hook protein FlgE
VDFTSNNLDLAISGQGFFVLQNTDGTMSYTRAGAYTVDRNGNVVNHSNDRLQVYPAVAGAAGTTSFNTGVLSDLQLPTIPSSPNPTDTVSASLNLNSASSPPTTSPFDPLDPSSYNDSTSTTVYDSLGTAHTSTLYFRKTGANAWQGYQYVDGNNVSVGGNASFPLTFSSSGALTAPAGGTVAMDAYTPSGGGAPLNMTLDFNGSTQYGTDFAVNNLTQDGYSSGRLAGVDIDSEGVVFARYTNGQSSALGKVAMAKFNNEQGLRQLGDTAWSESFASGNVQLGEAGTSSFGQIQSGALEASNVDVAEQLVNLITAQRNFQANAQVIQTGDQITQAIINLR